MLEKILSISPINLDETFVLLSLGTNVGDKQKNIELAYEALISSGILTNALISSFYLTEPVGVLEQDEFLNVAVAGFTLHSHCSLLQACKSIEYLLGREKRKRWHEREIDIDIIFYGNYEVSFSDLVIPHPRMHKRRFVLVPSAEIAGGYVHPSFGISVKQLLLECPDDSKVKYFG